MEKIYKQAKDEHVAGVVVYIKTENLGALTDILVAYKDAAKTERFTVAELRDAFFKGCVVNINDFYPENPDHAYYFYYVKPTQLNIVNESGVDLGILFGYYAGDDADDTLLSVFTWDGEYPVMDVE